MFEIFGDEIVFDGQTVGRLTISTGTLRHRVELAITDADADAKYNDGYERRLRRWMERRPEEAGLGKEARC